MVVYLKRRTDVDMPSEVEKAFNEHYNNVHLPLMAKVPGIVEIRRFKSVQETYAGTPMEGGVYVAEYEIESEDVLDQALSSPERKKALKDQVIMDYIKKYFTTTRYVYIPIK